MNCFKIPVSLIKEFESISANFFWNNSDNNKIHWIAWKKLCGGKKTSGLGFKDLRTFNLAMLAKQGWRIFKNPNLLLSRILKARYFSRGEFFDAKVGCNASYTWRSILDAQPILEDGIRWHIGDGRSVQV
ncbi:hypothetical protein Sango_1036900 [Sesamum angolense]|uniref:Uncharacterized protein n=1 Tax=Sesamum angolense TaxID=2727404 RepID=A0AAE2BYZ8_9LAMI|nr:hypothetical protein Sango_1036900 [Sesamum angolense]